MQFKLLGQMKPNSKLESTRFHLAVAICGLTIMTPSWAGGAEKDHTPSTNDIRELSGYSVPGAGFQVFLDLGNKENESMGETLGRDAIETIIQAFAHLVQQRSQYHRFAQALTQDMLTKVVIEPKVFNRDDKEFLFLVARTKHKGKVKLLINASRLQQEGYLNHPEILAPRLAKEFRWVVSKASPMPKREPSSPRRDLKQTPIHVNAAIKGMSPKVREQSLLALFDTYILTVDAYGSLTNQPHYQPGAATLVEPKQWDSTTTLYNLKIRDALVLIVKNPYFWKHTPKAVRSLLNGKVWQVMMAKIDDRDWTTRTRVVPKDKAVRVGVEGMLIQPAKVLVNYHRTMEPEEKLYTDTQGLPMGALTTDQLARVIAWEIQTQITEKSLRGHVAEDEKSSPDD